ncbi:MAG: VOC family protein [Candidatus Korobacteraceae bacterium]
MKQWLVVGVMMVFTVAPALAQLVPHNPEGITQGHVHLLSKDVDANKALFLAIGGKEVSKGNLQLIEFPGSYVMLRRGEPSGPSEGSTADHFGFMVKDMADAVAKWKAAGGTVEPGTAQQWFYTLDRAKIEVFEDKKQEIPIRFDHVHMFPSADKESETWYVKNFGAVPTNRNSPNYEESRIPGALLKFQRKQGKLAPSKGRALDHIGFEVKNIEQVRAKLEAAGAKFDGDTRNVPNTNLKVAFFTDPWGTYVEISENLAP